jgi:hypothetical protein
MILVGVEMIETERLILRPFTQNNLLYSRLWQTAKPIAALRLRRRTLQVLILTAEKTKPDQKVGFGFYGPSSVIVINRKTA